MKREGLRFFGPLLAAACITTPTGIGLTLAIYKTGADIDQQTGYLGKFDQESIFFNANIWEKDNALFYLYNNNANKWIAPTKTINPTIDETTFTLYVFILENPSAIDRSGTLTFMRVNPNGAHVPSDGEVVSSGAFVLSYFTETNKTVWNQTDNFTYDRAYNYYCIPTNGWASGSGYHNESERNSGCVKNILVLGSDNELEFSSGAADTAV